MLLNVQVLHAGTHLLQDIVLHIRQDYSIPGIEDGEPLLAEAVFVGIIEVGGREAPGDEMAKSPL